MPGAIAADALQGRVALVTGASRNLGRAIALALAGAGAEVAVAGHTDVEALEETAALVRALGRKAAVVSGDVADPADVERMVGRAVETLGPVDVLVSNASRRPKRHFLELTVEEWDGILRSNLSASFYLSRLVLAGMRERGFGRIILVGGPDGQRPELYNGAATRAHCNTAKAGLLGLMKAIAMEFGADGVTSNVVVPGIMDTTRDPVNYPHWPMSEEELRRRLAIPRLGRPVEVAEMCAFLASDSAAYVTGQTLHVSGGYLTP
ncbi:SDR family NAD(P)-dependent oxidoreductase [Phenylobacterium sp. J367]|uniref:SDR family NAD(P)-dependent oxidoreductase n=1 Tax=Phenylobacterium sp. J367 TaxID=2898435 RepID=UPI002151222B|nr:SDR family oxidoreductase [Phenylobacterium sp. J367]MCR5879583.1 SDR family oxidoreductase [Phenylobacterium sp. J367]